MSKVTGDKPRCEDSPLRKRAEAKQVVVGPTLVLAYQVVPGVESLPRVPGTARGLSNMESRGL